MFERFRRPILLGLIVTFFGATFGIAVGTAVVTLTNLPQVDQLEHYQPMGVTTLRDIRGKVIREIYLERRMYVPFEKIPGLVRNAFLATEDWRFYDHFGLDLQGLSRAILKNIFERRYAEGASTITQQLAKVLFLDPEKTLGRKLKEAMLAIQIERRYSKNEILGLYLNQIYLGSGCYGVEAAARTYFGKSVGDLSIAEIALLAGLPKGPNLYSPFKSPDMARERRNTVLQSMFERRLISQKELDNAREVPLPQEPVESDLTQSYFSIYVFHLLADQFGEELVYRGHLDVETTLDLEAQKAAEEAVGDGLEAYAKRHRIPLDKTEKLPQVALLAVDPANGEIRAMVGGRSFTESQFNRAIQAERQPGSSFKPILYAAALERGYTQSSLLLDEPIEFENSLSGKWAPKNYDKTYDGWIPLRVAVEESKNVVAVRLLQTIGISSLRKMAIRLGISSLITPNLSSALGSSSVTLPDLARAYSAFANGGIRHPLKAIRSVKSATGSDLWPAPAPSEPTIEPSLAYVMTDLLGGVIRSGTGRFASDLGCAVAGKTGTTDEFIDSLFAGFNSNLVAVAWIGFDDRKSLGSGETGAQGAGPIWKKFMEFACKTGDAEFHPPSGVLLVDVDHSSGKLPTRLCTDVLTEAFIDGTAPTETCSEEMEPNL